MATQITVKEAHHALEASAARLMRAAQRSATGPRDAATLSKSELADEIINKAGSDGDFKKLDAYVYGRAVATVSGQVGADDIKQVVTGMKAAVTRLAANGRFARAEATTEGLKAVYNAAVQHEAYGGGSKSSSPVQQKA